MWCAKCNKEYDDGFKICTRCGGNLTEYESIVSEDDSDDVFFESDEDVSEELKLEISSNDDDTILDSEPEILISVIGDREADRIMELLESNLIPAFKKLSESFDETSETDFEYNEDFEDYDDTVDEFAALCDEIPEDAEIYDIYVPKSVFQNAFRIVTEDEQSQTGETETQSEKVNTEQNSDDQVQEDADNKNKERFSFFSRLKKAKKVKDEE